MLLFMFVFANSPFLTGAELWEPELMSKNAQQTEGANT
jgi:hypothetical protein